MLKTGVLLLALAILAPGMAIGQPMREHLDIVIRGAGRQAEIETEQMAFDADRLVMAGASEREATGIVSDLIRKRRFTQAAINHVVTLTPVVAIASGWSMAQSATILAGAFSGNLSDLDTLDRGADILTATEAAMARAYSRNGNHREYVGVVFRAVDRRFQPIAAAYWKPLLDARLAQVRLEVAEAVGWYMVTGVSCGVGQEGMDAAERHALKGAGESEIPALRRALNKGAVEGAVKPTSEECAETREWFAKLLAPPPAPPPPAECPPDIDRPPICGPARVQRGSF